MYTPSTIYDSNGLPIMRRNSHDFKDGSGSAPKIGEIFFEVFTEPWMAYSYMKSQCLKDVQISLINTQKALDFLLLVGNGEHVNRIITNPCDQKNEPHERFFSMLPLEKITDIDDFVKIIADVEICPICYDKESFIKNNNMEETTTYLKYADK